MCGRAAEPIEEVIHGLEHLLELGLTKIDNQLNDIIPLRPDG